MVKFIVRNLITGMRKMVSVGDMEFEEIAFGDEGVRKNLFSVAKNLAGWDNLSDKDISVSLEDETRLIEINYPDPFDLMRRREIAKQFLNYVNFMNIGRLFNFVEDPRNHLEELRKEHLQNIASILEVANFSATRVYDLGIRIGHAERSWPNDVWLFASLEDIFDDIWRILFLEN
jgi:hypothetical protein